MDKEQILKREVKIFIKNGYINEIEKLIKVFFISTISVFLYTAPKEAKNIQHTIRYIVPNKKKNIYFVLNLFITLKLRVWANIKDGLFSISNILLSDKKIYLTIIVNIWEIANEILILGIKYIILYFPLSSYS